MIKHLTKHGNSLALVIDRGILDILKIGKDTPLSVTTDGRALTIAPARAEMSGEEFKSATDKVCRRYGPALKRLADA